LANELYSAAEGGAQAPPVSVPYTAAGFPAELPATPGPAAPAANGNRDIALSGGFPHASSATAPPVHPTVVAAEPEPVEKASEPPTGTHRPGDTDSHEFGEPSFHANGLGSRVSPPPATPPDHHSLPG